MSGERAPTETSAFGVGRRENHDSSAFYARFTAPDLSTDEQVTPHARSRTVCEEGDSRRLDQLADDSVALVVTSPPYFVGKEYEAAVGGDPTRRPQVPTSYLEYLEMLRDVFAECVRTLEPGGRLAVNVANLGRKPYRSLAADVVTILQDDLGLLLRGEIVWQKGRGSTGSCAWGSFRQAGNPVLRDVTERVIVASKGRFDRARTTKQRAADGLPHRSTLTTDEFMEATLDVWEIEPESARRVDHPAPFPVALPERLIELFTYEGDLVVDPFCGSGSTLVAAARTGRVGYGVDTDRTYVDLANRRVDDEVGPDRAGPSDLLDLEVRNTVVRAARKAADLSEEALAQAGFTIRASGRRLGEIGTSIDFVVTPRDAADDEPGIAVLLAGGFTSVRPGLLRSEAVWRTIARLSALEAGRPDDLRPGALILTSALPRRGTDPDRALRALAGRGLFDVLVPLAEAEADRLCHYAEHAPDRPIAGFWTETELDRGWP